jgi:hypothetical protein
VQWCNWTASSAAEVCQANWRPSGGGAPSVVRACVGKSRCTPGMTRTSLSILCSQVEELQQELTFATQKLLQAQPATSRPAAPPPAPAPAPAAAAIGLGGDDDDLFSGLDLAGASLQPAAPPPAAPSPPAAAAAAVGSDASHGAPPPSGRQADSPGPSEDQPAAEALGTARSDMCASLMPHARLGPCAAAGSRSGRSLTAAAPRCLVQGCAGRGPLHQPRC